MTRFLLSSPMASNDGYGSVGLSLLRAFDKQNVDFSAHLQPNARSLLPPRDQYILTRRQDGAVCELGVPVTSPDRFQLCPVLPQVGLTMFETTKAPPQFTQLLKRERAILGLVTPTESSKASLVSGGVTLPVEVAPLGYDPSDWYVDAGVERFKQFTFVTAGQLSYRKGTDLVVKAFEQEFDPKEPVGLILKTTTPWNLDVQPKDMRINIHAAEWSVDQMRTLFNQCHCYLGPSRGEGFGLVPLQAMACGLPVIVTNIPGGAPYLDWPNVGLVGWDGTENANTFWWHKALGFTDCGQWYVPSLAGLRRRMRQVYEEYKSGLWQRVEYPGLASLQWDHLVPQFTQAIVKLASMVTA